MAGSIVGALVNGRTAGAIAIGLVTLGLGAIVLLLFYEVGLSEEREVAREERRRERATDTPSTRRPRRRPRRPG